MANKVSLFPTSAENIALDLIFHWLGEERCNRTMDEYRSIAKRLPKLEALHAYVNEMLGDLARAGRAPFQICHFKKGDKYIKFVDFPTSVSRETVRLALVKSGMWQFRSEEQGSC
jgi:hypothetical protein